LPSSDLAVEVLKGSAKGRVAGSRDRVRPWPHAGTGIAGLIDHCQRDAIISDASDLIKRYGVSLDTARAVVTNGMLGDQPLPLQGPRRRS
jgi:hypothetical protein